MIPRITPASHTGNGALLTSWAVHSSLAVLLNTKYHLNAHLQTHYAVLDINSTYITRFLTFSRELCGSDPGLAFILANLSQSANKLTLVCVSTKWS